MQTLSGRTGSALAWHTQGPAAAGLRIRNPYLQRVIRGAQEVLPMRVGGGGGCDQSIGSTVSDALTVAGCSRLQLGAPHWATSVDYCK